MGALVAEIEHKGTLVAEMAAAPVRESGGSPWGKVSDGEFRPHGGARAFAG